MLCSEGSSMKSRQLPCADVAARVSRGRAVLGTIKDRYSARPRFTIHSSAPESRGDSEAVAAAGTTAAAKSEIFEIPVPSLKRLQSLFDLTAAEARLAQLIARGDSVEEVAQKLSIKMTTARTQLAAVFAKTETRRQAKLVAILSRIAHLEERAACAERIAVPDAAA